MFHFYFQKIDTRLHIFQRKISAFHSWNLTLISLSVWPIFSPLKWCDVFWGKADEIEAQDRFSSCLFSSRETLFSCNILRILIGRFQMNGTRVGSFFFLSLSFFWGGGHSLCGRSLWPRESLKKIGKLTERRLQRHAMNFDSFDVLPHFHLLSKQIFKSTN